MAQSLLCDAKIASDAYVRPYCGSKDCTRIVHVQLIVLEPELADLMLICARVGGASNASVPAVSLQLNGNFSNPGEVNGIVNPSIIVSAGR